MAESARVLAQIGDLANRLDCENFTQAFDKALKTLRGEIPVGEYYAVSFAALPQPNLRAFAAAWIADVFGAMPMTRHYIRQKKKNLMRNTPPLRRAFGVETQ